MAQKINLVGKKFGRLTVIEEAKKHTKSSAAHWLCECECGNRKIVLSHNLRDGQVRSCGCITKERLSELSKSACFEGTKIIYLNQNKAKNNKTGCKGVSWSRNLKKYHAYITFKGKRYNLGFFDELEDAINARKNAELYYYSPVIKKYEEG